MHLIKTAGLSCKTAQTGAVTRIQRCGSALNLNIHFHLRFPDGVYVERAGGSGRFRWSQHRRVTTVYSVTCRSPLPCEWQFRPNFTVRANPV
jgi:hypothetical protein